MLINISFLGDKMVIDKNFVGQRFFVFSLGVFVEQGLYREVLGSMEWGWKK